MFNMTYTQNIFIFPSISLFQKEMIWFPWGRSASGIKVLMTEAILPNTSCPALHFPFMHFCMIQVHPNAANSIKCQSKLSIDLNPDINIAWSCCPEGEKTVEMPFDLNCESRWNIVSGYCPSDPNLTSWNM